MTFNKRSTQERIILADDPNEPQDPPQQSREPDKPETGPVQKQNQKARPEWVSKLFWVVIAALVTFLLTRTWNSFSPAVQLVRQIEDSSCQIVFDYRPHRSCDSAYWELQYSGPADLDDYWIRESIYWVGSGGVDECPDLPHFEYYYYQGNPRSMGTLEEGQNVQYHLRPCWQKLMADFSDVSQGRLVSRIVLTGSSEHEPEFERDWYFVLDPSRCYYQEAKAVVGGELLVAKVQRYLSVGPRSVMRYMRVEGRRGYFRNPPEMWYWSDTAQSEIPWYGEGFPPTGTATTYPEFNPWAFTPTGRQSISLMWDCDEGRSVAFHGIR